MNKKLSAKKSFILLIIVSFIIEIVLSNITYLNILNCEKKNVVSKFSQNISGELMIYTNNIQVQNIKIYYKNEGNTKSILEYTPSTVVLGFNGYKRILEKSFSTGNINKRININSENKTLRLYLKILNKSNDKIIKANQIDKIVLNDLHIEFSIIRFLLIFILSVLSFILKKINTLYMIKIIKSRVF